MGKRRKSNKRKRPAWWEPGFRAGYRSDRKLKSNTCEYCGSHMYMYFKEPFGYFWRCGVCKTYFDAGG